MSHGATYRNVFHVPEFRALFAANVLSTIGDMLTRVAVAVVVFDRTGSSLLTAIAFAVSFLPNLLVGPVLAAIADHYPRKTVLVACDVTRAVVIGVVAIGILPLVLVYVLLFLSGLITFPAWAARSAVLPSILTGDLYTLGVAVSAGTYQVCQILGFALGGALIAAWGSYEVLFFDAATFVWSAVILSFGLRARPAPVRPEKRGSLIGDTLTAFSTLLKDRVVRKILLLVWLASAFVWSQEGLAPSLAASLDGGGLATGLLLAAAPAGMATLGVILTRILPPNTRLRLIPYLAIAACLALIPVGFNIPLWMVFICYFLAGAGMTVTIWLNAAYNRLLPSRLRGRAAGLAIAGLTLSQAAAIISAGMFADMVAPGWVVTGAGTLGCIVIFLVVRHWPDISQPTTPIKAQESLP